jgi:1-acyl-sn-glycerol-3-phosphate acyltransferase
MGEFKPGLWHLAKKHPEVELVPVHLENLNRILPKGDFLLVPLLAAVTFGPPIKFDEAEDKMMFLGRAKHAVEALSHGAEQ